MAWIVGADTYWPGYSEPLLEVTSGDSVIAQEICDALGRAQTPVVL